MRPSRAAAAAAVVVVTLAACSDDDAAPTTPATTEVATTPAPTTAEPTTTSATTTSPPTTAAPTTTVDVEALKAQIAADYLKTTEALKVLARAPTADALEQRVADVAVPGSYVYTTVLASIRRLIANGQHAVAGDPDYADFTVESVELVGSPSDGAAEVTACAVSNQYVVGPNGQPVNGPPTLSAARIRQPMHRTPDGWRQSEQATGLSIQQGVTTCG